MANKRNNWMGLRDLANKELKEKGAMILVRENEDGFYDIEILFGLDFKAEKFDITKYDECYEYAVNYFEDELSDVVTEAWHYASNKLGQ